MLMLFLGREYLLFKLILYFTDTRHWLRCVLKFVNIKLISNSKVRQATIHMYLNGNILVQITNITEQEGQREGNTVESELAGLKDNEREEIVAHDGDEDTREAIDVITGTFNIITTNYGQKGRNAQYNTRKKKN